MSKLNSFINTQMFDEDEVNWVFLIGFELVFTLKTRILRQSCPHRRRRDIQRYYLAPKKRETSGFLLWSKVFLDKGITNRTIGRIWFRSTGFTKDHGRYWLKRKKGTRISELHLLAELHCCGGSIGYCEWVWICHGSLRTTVPSTR